VGLESHAWLDQATPQAAEKANHVARRACLGIVVEVDEHVLLAKRRNGAVETVSVGGFTPTAQSRKRLAHQSICSSVLPLQ
jgi:hypothetical protein